MSNPDTLAVERLLVRHNDYILRSDLVTCPVRRRLLKQEQHKLRKREYRRKKMIKPAAATVLRYRGSTFVFNNIKGQQCGIQINSDNTEIMWSHRTTSRNVVPLVGAKAWIQASIDHAYYDCDSSSSEDECADIRGIRAEWNEYPLE
jgi:hypothetical protein